MFDGARLKIKRANRHIRDFESEIMAFVESDFYSISFDLNEHTGKSSLNFRVDRSPSDDLALILGDAVHNIRSSLDLAYVELVELAGKQPGKWTTLRIFQNRNALVTTLGQGIFQGESDIIDMLADEVRAYEGGNSPLEALNALDISDKHVLILPVVSVSKVTGVDVSIVGDGGSVNVRNQTFSIADSGGIRLATVGGVPTSIDIQDKGKPSVAILFGDGTSLKGKPIIPTLMQFSQLADGIINVFESTIKARSA